MLPTLEYPTVYISIETVNKEGLVVALHTARCIGRDRYILGEVNQKIKINWEQVDPLAVKVFAQIAFHCGKLLEYFVRKKQPVQIPDDPSLDRELVWGWDNMARMSIYTKNRFIQQYADELIQKGIVRLLTQKKLRGRMKRPIPVAYRAYLRIYLSSKLAELPAYTMEDFKKTPILKNKSMMISPRKSLFYDLALQRYANYVLKKYGYNDINRLERVCNFGEGRAQRFLNKPPVNSVPYEFARRIQKWCRMHTRQARMLDKPGVKGGGKGAENQADQTD